MSAVSKQASISSVAREIDLLLFSNTAKSILAIA